MDDCVCVCVCVCVYVCVRVRVYVCVRVCVCVLTRATVLCWGRRTISALLGFKICFGGNVTIEQKGTPHNVSIVGLYVCVSVWTSKSYFVGVLYTMVDFISALWE